MFAIVKMLWLLRYRPDCVSWPCGVQRPKFSRHSFYSTAHITIRFFFLYQSIQSVCFLLILNKTGCTARQLSKTTHAAARFGFYFSTLYFLFYQLMAKRRQPISLSSSVPRTFSGLLASSTITTFGSQRRASSSVICA